MTPGADSTRSARAIFAFVLGLAELGGKQVILVLGKGGVGRTTVAAALALALARRGRRTLLFQANANERLSQLLGRPRIGPEVTRVTPNLWAVNTNPDDALREYGLMVLKFETVYKMVLENRLVKGLIRAIPGLDDYSVIGKLWWHTTELEDGRPRFDTVVFDAPATGHAATMLRIPGVILETVPDGPLKRDAGKVRAMLTDPSRTAAVLVTLAEEMPAAETVDLGTRIAALRIPLAGRIVNQLYPDRFTGGTPAGQVLAAVGAQDDPSIEGAITCARLIAARRRLNEEYLARLAAALGGDEARLPRLFGPSIGPAETDRLSILLDDQLRGAP